ncbi:MAG: hypothetical protein EKK48_03125 [Candidatus Melainabacteria bacterium]|nr:MAG: hypothetical protein EKK48_03125 [Candidatus Melainabacteria bacterium]
MLQISSLAPIPIIAEPPGNSDSTAFEQHYHETLSMMRQTKLSEFAADSKMPFALKQRQIELPMLEYSVALARSSPKWRQVIVKSLIENIEQGPGHFSVHRAKDALKQIALAIGIPNLSSMLKSQDLTESEQAAELLGWLKNSRAAQPLLMSLKSDHPLRQRIGDIVGQHYSQYRIEAATFEVIS